MIPYIALLVVITKAFSFSFFYSFPFFFLSPDGY